MEPLTATLYADGLPPARVTLVFKPAAEVGGALHGFFLLPAGWDDLRPGLRCALRSGAGRVGRFVVRRVGRPGLGGSVVAAEFAAPPAALPGYAAALPGRATFKEWRAG